MAKNLRTGEVGLNLPLTLAIETSENAPLDEVPGSRYLGRYYTVGDTPWDRKAFALLVQVFQMTVTDVSQVGVPITISK